MPSDNNRCSLPAAATLLGASYNTVLQLAARGGLGPIERDGRRVYVSGTTVRALAHVRQARAAFRSQSSHHCAH